MIAYNINTPRESLIRKEPLTGEKHILSTMNSWQTNSSRIILILNTIILCWFLLASIGCGSGSSSKRGSQKDFTEEEIIIVTSLTDKAFSVTSMSTKVTLREAMERVISGGTILFDPSLNGKTIKLKIVGSNHSILKGEVYSGGPPQFQGYQERDYGKSSLYAKKDITIDASNLPDGITIMWAGGDANRARVLAVYGDLTMKNVTITSGYASAEALSEGHITVWLKGKKLKGGYALTRFKRKDDENWLLVKMSDDHADARRNPLSTQPESAISGRTIEQIKEEEK